MVNDVARPQGRNVLGGELRACSYDPLTGFYRDGCCHTGPHDAGLHTVCARVTAAFLDFTRMQGNDLVTSQPAACFPGLKPGDCWCLCAARWWQAYEAGVAPPVVLEATHERALALIPLPALLAHAWQSGAAPDSAQQGQPS